MIAMIGVALIIIGGLTMVPSSELGSISAPGLQAYPQPAVREVSPTLRPTQPLPTPDDLSNSKPLLQVTAGSELAGEEEDWYLPFLGQQAVPAVATVPLQPDPMREPLLPPPDGVTRTIKLPILMYHYISELPPDADKIRRGLTVTPATFEAHLKYLKEAGYETISLHQLMLHLTRGEPLPPKPIILTFDDGYRDVYENAFPLLTRYGFKGTFFLITNFIDEGRPLYLTWEQVKEMAAAGHEIGAHSRDHPDLRGRDIDFLVWQILGSKEAIQNGAGITPRFFSYPSGKYDENVIAVLASAHYWGAATVIQGVDQSSATPFELQRIRIDGSYGAEQLDWLLKYYMGP